MIDVINIVIKLIECEITMKKGNYEANLSITNGLIAQKLYGYPQRKWRYTDNLIKNDIVDGLSEGSNFMV